MNGVTLILNVERISLPCLMGMMPKQGEKKIHTALANILSSNQNRHSSYNCSVNIFREAEGHKIISSQEWARVGLEVLGGIFFL